LEEKHFAGDAPKFAIYCRFPFPLHIFPPPLPFRCAPLSRSQVYKVPLSPRGWRVHSGGVAEEATREDLLTALSDVDAILVRASIVRDGGRGETVLKKAMLDIAQEAPTGYAAAGVEECVCPEGYAGRSCQECDAGFYRDPADRSRGPLGRYAPFINIWDLI